MAPLAVKVALVPWQITPLLADEFKLRVGAALMDTVKTVGLYALLQPFAAVPVTVYTVVAEGVAVTLAPPVALKPAGGLQV